MAHDAGIGEGSKPLPAPSRRAKPIVESLPRGEGVRIDPWLERRGFRALHDNAIPSLESLSCPMGEKFIPFTFRFLDHEFGFGLWHSCKRH